MKYLEIVAVSLGCFLETCSDLKRPPALLAHLCYQYHLIFLLLLYCTPVIQGLSGVFPVAEKAQRWCGKGGVSVCIVYPMYIKHLTFQRLKEALALNVCTYCMLYVLVFKNSCLALCSVLS